MRPVEAAARARRAGGVPVRRRATTAPTSAASRSSPTSAPSRACSAKALGQVLRTEVDLACAGRTDAGVHAWGQVVSFEAPPGHRRRPRCRRASTAMLGPEIVVRAADLVPAGFDARHSATSARVPVHDREPAGARTRSAPGTRGTCPRPLDLSVLRWPPIRSSARTTSPSFCKKGPEGKTHGPPGHRVGVARPRRRRAALRGARQRVLLRDGALDRRDDRRRRARQAPPRRHAHAPAGRRPRQRPPSPRRTGCASGTSATPTR